MTDELIKTTIGYHLEQPVTLAQATNPDLWRLLPGERQRYSALLA